MEEERCVMCGETIPEGSQVCGCCRYKVMGKCQSIESGYIFEEVGDYFTCKEFEEKCQSHT